jgi:predicted transcriptional regulator of viral defense system
MNYRKLKAIEQLYFGYHELARVLDISIDAARVTAVRYVQQGILVRLKRNVYVHADRWEHLTTPELFALANVGQTPSYVSLMSALCFYKVSTQIQRGFVESIAVHRTTTIEVGGVVFSYVKVKPALYGDFSRREGFFIAEPEKAYVDAMYLACYGHYRLDHPSLDFRKFDQSRIKAIGAKYPTRVVRCLEKAGD